MSEFWRFGGRVVNSEVGDIVFVLNMVVGGCLKGVVLWFVYGVSDLFMSKVCC